MKKWAITSFILFLIILPLSLNIDFFQNDDWVYYKNVTYFEQGNLDLDPYLGPTFFAQGLLGLTFSKVFGLGHLPVLTLTIGILNFFIFGIILIKFYKKTYIQTLLLSGLYFFNPLQIYLLWGFMTGLYFMFILLSSLYLFLDNKVYWAYLLSCVGIFIRQVSTIIPLGIGLYLLYKKDYKKGFAGLAVFAIQFLYLQKFFPLTQVMQRAALQYQHLANFNRSFALTYGALIMISAFLLPLMFSSIKVKRKPFLVLGAAIIIFLLFNSVYKPSTISWGEFPYFENIFERTGFYPRGIHGTKYQFVGIYDFYYYWDLGAKIILALLVSNLVVRKKLKINVFIVISLVYLFLMLLVETFYDRYLLLFIPLIILYLVDLDVIRFTRLNKLLIGAFTVLMIFVTYNFSMDFILMNKYGISKAQSLDVEPQLIHATNAWKLNYKNTNRDYVYFFSYDSPDVNPDLKTLYTLEEKQEITYPFNFFINPYVYLYKKI